MSSSRFRHELYRVLLHPLISISTSASGILAIVWLIGVNFGNANPRASIILGVLFATIVEAVVGNILYKERSGIGNRARELVFYLMLLYVVFSLARPGALREKFFPSFDQMVPIVASGIAWIVAFVLHDRLRGREALLRTFGGATGSELRRAVLARQHDMALTVAQLRKARGLITSVFVIACLLALAAGTNLLRRSVLPQSPWSFIMLIISGITSISVMGTINAFIEEYGANGEGLAVPFRFQRRRLLAGFSMLLLVLILAFGLSRREGVLPIEAIGDALRWFARLFERDANRVVEEPFPEPPPQPEQISPDMVDFLRSLEEPEPPPLWLRILARLVERLGLVALVVGLTALLFGPLFSEGFREGIARLGAWRKIKAFFAALRQRLKILGRFLRAGVGRRRAERLDEAGEEPPRAWRSSRWKPSLRKRRQMDRVLQVFADISRWGGQNGVSYARHEAAREYLSRIATVRPEHYQDAMVVAETFCEARFSTHVLPRERIRDYVAAAKRITSAR